MRGGFATQVSNASTDALTTHVILSGLRCLGYRFHMPFPISFGFTYILLVIDYVLKWVEAKATRTNDAQFFIDFVRSHIFCRFGIPRVVVSD